MPFNIGPFEMLLLVIVVIGIAYLVIRSATSAGVRSGTAPRAQPSGVAATATPDSLDDLLAQGWRIESETDHNVYLVSGQRVNHVLHFLVGLFTLGVWWIVWLILAATGGETRRTFTKTRRREPSETLRGPELDR